MLDKQKINDFWVSRTQVADPRLATNYRDDGRLGIDVALVKRHVAAGASILDLGAGTCTLSMQLLSYAGRVVAVEKFAEFLAVAGDQQNLEKVCCDVSEFQTAERFDAILLFGVANFLTPEEEQSLYENCRQMLRAGGVFIVKHQCGEQQEVVVDGFSPELGSHYHARYPHVAQSRAMLDGLFSVEVIDIYPASLNRWSETHFYAFLCRGK